MALVLGVGAWFLADRGTASQSQPQTAANAVPATDAALSVVAPDSPANALDPAGAELVARVSGRWAFVGSGDCAVFSIAGNTLVQHWPGIEEAREHVDFADGHVVRTTVETPVAQRGQRFEYRVIASGQLEVRDVQSGRRDELRGCGETN